MREEDYKYDAGLLLFGAAIGYISTLAGGIPLLLLLGLVAVVVIGYRATSLLRAAGMGAFFGVIVVTASSQLVQGFNGDLHDDILLTVFVPYFIAAAVAAGLGGGIAALSYRVLSKK